LIEKKISDLTLIVSYKIWVTNSFLSLSIDLSLG